jgi:hypothetical protein
MVRFWTAAMRTISSSSQWLAQSVSKPAMRKWRASLPRCTSATKRGSRSARGRSRTSGVMSRLSNIGYTATRSPPRSTWAKSTDTPSTRMRSTSGCGTPTDSIASFTERARSISTAKPTLRRSGGRKSFSSS